MRSRSQRGAQRDGGGGRVASMRRERWKVAEAEAVAEPAAGAMARTGGYEGVGDGQEGKEEECERSWGGRWRVGM